MEICSILGARWVLAPRILKKKKNSFDNLYLLLKMVNGKIGKELQDKREKAMW